MSWKNKELDFYSLKDHFSSRYNLLNDFAATPQDAEWHAEGDVAIHTNMVIHEAKKIAKNDCPHLFDEMILGALFHDIFKPISTKEKEIDGKTRVVAPGHEENGYNYLYYKLKEDSEFMGCAQGVLDIVGFHQAPKLLVVRNANKWEYLDSINKYNSELMYHFAKADILGRECPDKSEQLDYIELFKIELEDLGFWGEFEDPIIKALKNQNVEEKHFKFLRQKAMYHLKKGDIYDPAEIVSKYFESLKNGYSTVDVLVGLSGAGKSSYVDSQKEKEIISLDSIREEFSKNRDRKYEGQVLQEAKKRLTTALAKKVDVIYDATSIRKDFRQKILTHTINYDSLYNNVFIETPVSECIKNDKDREFSVGEALIRKQEQNFQHPIFD